jgi:hypothetical protein
MGSIKNKPFKFNKTMVVKGAKTIGADPDKGITEEEANEVIVREFTKGAVVDANYIGGRGGSSISFELEGGIRPNGEAYDGKVNYVIPTDAQHNPIDENIPMPKVAEVVEDTESAEAGQRKSTTILTPTNIAIGVIGVLGVFILLKATKVIK